MNAPSLTQPTVNRDTESGSFVIGMRLVIPDGLEPMQMIYPKGNWVTAIILRRNIKHAIAAEGVTCTSAGGGGPFNTSIYIFEVLQLVPALEVLKRELGFLGLLPLAQICFFDAREMVWRCAHPANASVLEFAKAFTSKEAERTLSEFLEMQQRAMEQLKQLAASGIPNDGHN